MSRNRFEDILAILHFNDNMQCPRDKDDPKYDRLYKLLPLVSYLRKKFEDSVGSETCQAIDEQMVPFKGKHGGKVYMPKKPYKWGFKLWCRAGISGYIYDFDVCGERRAKGPPENMPDAHKYDETEPVAM